MKFRSIKLKKMLAGFLVVILALTSAPIAIAVTPGEYDPTPYFTEANTINVKSYGTLNSYGDINILFTQAAARKNYNNTQNKQIEYYIATLSEITLGVSAHSGNASRDILTKKIPAGNTINYGDWVSSSITKQEILDSTSNIGIRKGYKYNIRVIAVDTYGWRSEPVDCLVSEVPMYGFNDDFSPKPDLFAKEMLRMEQAGTGAGQSSDGTTQGTDYQYRGDADALHFNGISSSAGDTNGVDGSRGYRFWINKHSETEKNVLADITWSRQGYNYTGAQEAWFWVDLSDVMFEKLSFQIGYNYKKAIFWKDDIWTNGKIENKNNFSEVKYTTVPTATANGHVGNVGTKPVYIQTADGLWQEIEMEDGYLKDFGNYKGYVRIPIDYFCSDKDTVITYDNLPNKNKNDGNGNKLSEPQLVNPAGTKITDADIVVSRYFSYKNYGVQEVHTKLGDMRPRADEPQKVIADLYSAGFTYTGETDDSVKKAFYMDNVLFTSENEFVVGEFPGADQKKVKDYYDRNIEIPKFIAKYIEKNIPENPTIMDTETVLMIDEIFTIYGFDLNSLAAYPSAQAIYSKAKNVCQGMIDDKISAVGIEPVKWFEREVEKLPNANEVKNFTIELDDNLKTLKVVYDAFDRGQIELLGSQEEQKFLELYSLAVGSEEVVGSAVGENPFIPFNDFETNHTIGQKAYELYDDYPNYKDNLPMDVQHTKNFTSYSSNSRQFVLAGFDQLPNTGENSSISPLNPNRVISNITNEGFSNSNGASMFIKTKELDYYFRTMATTYKGGEASSGGNCSSLPLLDLSGLKQPFTSGIPLSLVFYVDFSQIKDFKFTVKIITANGTSQDQFFLNFGSNAENQTLWYMDESGDWIQTSSGSSGFALSSSAFNNYKGFIRIPLYHFKKYSGAMNEKLDENEALARIQQVKFSIWSDDAYSEGLKGKTVTFDNIGFTYDPQTYTGGAMRPGDKAFDEQYGVKTTNSIEFEQGVNKLDVYGDKAQLRAQIDILANDYSKLSDYQKTFSSVKNANNRLEEVRNMLDTGAIPPDSTLQELNNAVSAMPEKAKNTELIGEKALPFPGYDLNGNVKYEELGFTLSNTAERDDIKKAYLESYGRLTNADRQTFEASPEYKQLKNAYTAVLRVEMLEKIKSDSAEFADVITELYAKNDYNLSIENNQENKDALKEYYSLSVFSKEQIGDNLVTSKMSAAVYSVVVNSTSLTFTNRETAEGVINKKITEFKNVIADVGFGINAKQEFDSSMIKRIEDCLGEYEQYINQYQKIVELRAEYDLLSSMLPYGSARADKEIILKDELELTVNVDSYVAARESQAVVLVINSEFTMKQISGAANDITPAEVPFKVKQGGEELVTGKKIGEFKNSGTNSNMPAGLNFSVEKNDIKDFDLSAVLEGKVTINCYDKKEYDNNSQTAKLLSAVDMPVKFTLSESTYSVTIPADVTVVFGSENTAATPIEVDSDIPSFKQLQISCLKDEVGSDYRAMKYEKADVNGEYPKLRFKPMSGSSVFNDIRVPESVGTYEIPLGINIAQSDWKKAYAGDYSGNLTFEVSYLNR